MKIIKAIIVGGFIWILGASFYSISYFFPFLEDLELQANLVLAISLMPNAWLGARLYYKWERDMHGLKLGAIAMLTAILLDVLITAPLLIIAYGGSYEGFFTAPAFWLIAAEYLLIILIYWNFKVKPNLNYGNLN